jgi:hypothetical protein
LSAAKDWELKVDLEKKLAFPGINSRDSTKNKSPNNLRKYQEIDRHGATQFYGKPAAKKPTSENMQSMKTF